MDFSKDCNSKAAIESGLWTLFDFEELVSARMTAYDKGDKSLTDWVVLGRFILSKNGQFSIFLKGNQLPPIPAELYPDLPRVMTEVQFNQYIKDHPSTDYKGYFLSFYNLPPNHIFCPVCGEPWGVSNCHDSVTNIEHQDIPLTEFIGKKLGEVREIWSKKTTEMWHLQPDYPIQNDRYIDHTIVDSEEGRRNHFEKNSEGRIKAGNDYTIIPGDIAKVNVWTFRHHKCDEKVHIAKYHEYFENIFKEAGFKSIHLFETTQVFLGEDHLHNYPWFQVFADDIPFRIGWEHSVLSLHSNDFRIDFQAIFSKEDVTKTTHWIHAYNSTHCITLLKIIRESLPID